MNQLPIYNTFLLGNYYLLPIFQRLFLLKIAEVDNVEHFQQLTVESSGVGGGWCLSPTGKMDLCGFFLHMCLVPQLRNNRVSSTADYAEKSELFTKRRKVVRIIGLTRSLGQ